MFTTFTGIKGMHSGEAQSPHKTYPLDLTVLVRSYFDWDLDCDGLGGLNLELLTDVPERHWLAYSTDCMGLLWELRLDTRKYGVADFLLEHGLCPGQQFTMHLHFWADVYDTAYGPEHDNGIDVHHVVPVPYEGDPAQAWLELLPPNALL